MGRVANWRCDTKITFHSFIHSIVHNSHYTGLPEVEIAAHVSQYNALFLENKTAVPHTIHYSLFPRVLFIILYSPGFYSLFYIPQGSIHYSLFPRVIFYIPQGSIH
jgi:hypothetical protein